MTDQLVDLFDLDDGNKRGARRQRRGSVVAGA